jgi:hypothetical protein
MGEHADTTSASSSGQQQQQQQQQQWDDDGTGECRMNGNDSNRSRVEMQSRCEEREEDEKGQGLLKSRGGRDDVESFLRMILASVASLHDRLDRSIHRVSEVPMDELDGFVRKEKVMLEMWCSERIKEFDAVIQQRE